MQRTAELASGSLSVQRGGLGECQLLQRDRYDGPQVQSVSIVPFDLLQ